MKTRLTNTLLGVSFCLFASHFLHAQQKSSTLIKSNEKSQQISALEEANSATLDLQNSATYKLQMLASVKGTKSVAPTEDKNRLAAELQKLNVRKEQSIAAKKERNKITQAVSARLGSFHKMKGEIKSIQKEKKPALKNAKQVEIDKMLIAKKLGEIERLKLEGNETNQSKH